MGGKLKVVRGGADLVGDFIRSDVFVVEGTVGAAGECGEVKVLGAKEDQVAGLEGGWGAVGVSIFGL